jgi:hypothetical protein
VAADGSGRVWLLPTVAAGTSPVIDVFAPGGTLLRTLRLGHAARQLRVRGDRLLVTGENELGEPVLHVYRITG